MKNEILKKIDHAILTEDEGIPIYSKHIENTLFLSGFDNKTRDIIKETLMQLKRESQVHKALLLHVKKLVSERY